MRAGVAVVGHLPRLGRGDEQEIAGVGYFEIAEAELGLGGGRADVAHGIVAAGVEHDDFLLRARQRFKHLVHQHAARHLLALAIHIGVHGHEHVALGRADAVARVEHEGEVRALGLLRELGDGGGKAIAGHVEAAGPLAVAGDGVEAALREQPRHALRVDAGVVQRVQLRVGAVADDERHALFRRRVRRRDECGQKNAGDKANAHARLPLSISGTIRGCRPDCAIGGARFRCTASASVHTILMPCPSRSPIPAGRQETRYSPGSREASKRFNGAMVFRQIRGGRRCAGGTLGAPGKKPAIGSESQHRHRDIFRAPRSPHSA